MLFCVAVLFCLQYRRVSLTYLPTYWLYRSLSNKRSYRATGVAKNWLKQTQQVLVIAQYLPIAIIIEQPTLPTANPPHITMQ